MEVLGLGTTPSALASSGNSMGSSGHSKPSVVHGVPHEQSLLLDGSLATDFPHLHYMVAFLTYSCCKRSVAMHMGCHSGKRFRLHGVGTAFHTYHMT